MLSFCARTDKIITLSSSYGKEDCVYVTVSREGDKCSKKHNERKKLSTTGRVNTWNNKRAITTVVLSFKHKVLRLLYKHLTYPVWWVFAASSLQGAPAHTFLSPIMVATQIKLWEVSVCVHACTRGGVCYRVCSQLLPLQVLRASLTQCVSLKYFIRSSQQLQTGLICVVCFNVSVRVCLCPSKYTYVCVCVSVCYTGQKRLLFQGSLWTTHWSTLL